MRVSICFVLLCFVTTLHAGSTFETICKQQKRPKGFDSIVDLNFELKGKPLSPDVCDRLAPRASAETAILIDEPVDDLPAMLSLFPSLRALHLEQPGIIKTLKLGDVSRLTKLTLKGDLRLDALGEILQAKNLSSLAFGGKNSSSYVNLAEVAKLGALETFMAANVRLKNTPTLEHVRKLSGLLLSNVFVDSEIRKDKLPGLHQLKLDGVRVSR